jgi:hypothetical protein
VAEDPEEVLPQHRIAADGDVEEVEAPPALELEQEAGGGQRRDRERGREHCP